MDAPELRLDYFQFYDVGNQDAGYVVGLQGQFDKYAEKVRLNYLNLFANPASKNGEPFYDKNAHLTWYDLYDPVPDPTRVVYYQNQFGEQRLITGRSYALLAPTQKRFKGSSFPEQLDHYKVYEVLEGEPVNRPVKLEDQFGQTETRVYYPAFFGVPVKKWWEGQTFGIHNERAHLVFYKISPNSAEQTIVTRDQFGQRLLHVFRSVLLAAPSVKLKWQEV